MMPPEPTRMREVSAAARVMRISGAVQASSVHSVVLGVPEARVAELIDVARESE